MTHPLAVLLSIAALIFLCAYFSVGEASVSSVSAARARAWAEDNPSFDSLVQWQLNNRQKVIIAILVAHNLFSVTASSLLTFFTSRLWGESSVLWSTTVMTVLMVLFADFLPKCIGMAIGERTFTAVLPGLKAAATLFKPAIFCLERIVFSVSRLFHVDMSLESSMVTRDEIEQLVKNGEESGAIEPSERRMIDGVIALDETRVSEIMVPRTSVDALEVSRKLGDVLSCMRNWEHSRIPVYSGTLDNVAGVVYLKDMISHLRAGALETPLKSLMRPAFFIPETMRVNDLFNSMRSQHVHFAVVVDEYGGTAGIVTLEDLLEEIVGDIRDEYDDDSAPIVQLSDTSYRVKCAESLDDFENAVGYNFNCDAVDSVGGYVLDRFNGFPQKGDEVAVGEWTIKVTDVGEHRVNEVVFTRTPRPKADGLPAESGKQEE
ncbi:MAG: hemolysin family protein [Pyramidobacter sp.]|jgi:putative hemolysin